MGPRRRHVYKCFCKKHEITEKFLGNFGLETFRKTLGGPTGELCTARSTPLNSRFMSKKPGVL